MSRVAPYFSSSCHYGHHHHQEGAHKPLCVYRASRVMATRIELFFFFFLTSFIIIITSAIIIISAAAAAAAAALYRDKPLFSSFCVVVVGRLQQFIAYIYSLRCAVIMRAGKYANEAQCSGPTTSSGVKSQREPP